MPRQKKEIQLQDSDWEALFPGEDHTIGSTTFKIEPLSIDDLSIILKRIATITSQLSELDLEFNDFKGGGTDRIIQLIQLIVDEAPDILSQMSGLGVADIKSLPLSASVDLFNKVLDVNIKSQEDLIKNFKGLAERFKTFTNPTAEIQEKKTQERAVLQ